MTFAREFRRAPTRWTVPVFAWLVAWLTINTMPDGLFLWADASYGLAEARPGINPLAAGVLAWVAGRRVRTGWFRKLGLAMLDPIRPILWHFLANLAWVLVGWLTAFGAIAIWMAIHDGAGVPFYPWLASHLASLVLSCAAGYALGIVGRGFWAIPPGVALSAYLTFALAGGAPRTLALMTPLHIEGVDPFTEFIPESVWGSVIWYVFAGASVLALVALACRADRRHWLQLLSAAIAASIGATLMLAHQGQMTREAETTRVCRQLSVTLCVASGYEAAFAELDRQFAALNERAAGTSLVARRLQHRARGGSAAPSGWRAFYLDDFRYGLGGMAVEEYVWDYSRSEWCWSSGDAWPVHQMVSAWLADVPTEIPYGREGILTRGWLARSDEELNAWLQEHELDYLYCRLTWDDLR